MTFGSLFSGAGGIDLGFERAGLVCKWQVEIDKHCWGVLWKHWPNVPKWDDVRTFPPDFGTYWGSVDIICGGDPCQENSGARATGECQQSSLGGEFVRVVKALRPRIVVRENPTHVRKDAPWPWWRMRTELESLGYAVLPFRLRACCFGAFHQRDRMFLLAERANPNGNGLARRKEKAKGRDAGEPSRRIHASDWMAVSASRGLGSRAGLSGYVDRVRAIGNSVYPAVAQWIGERIVEANQ